MEIRQLEAFAAVQASGSVTAAARLLDRSQPVVSRQLQDLEQELGFTLFTRTRPQVTLTDQGLQFLEEVHNVLTGLQQLEARSREISEGRSRPLRVASSLSLGNGLVPAAIAALFERDHSFQHKLYLEVMPSAQIIEALHDGHVDVAFTSLPLEFGRCRLHWSAQAGCVVALPEGHPLAAQTSVSALQLVGTTVITPSNASGMRHRLSTALLHPSRPSMQRQIITNSTMSAVMMTRDGLGVALIDPCMAQYIQPAGVVYKPLEAYVPYIFGAVTHGERPLSNEARTIIEAVREHAFQHIPHLAAGDSTGVPTLTQPLEVDAQESPERGLEADSRTAGSVLI